MQAIIMAGGEGTRLRPLTCNIPKPLAPLCGRPVLEYILELLKSNSFSKATLTLMYQADKIVNHFDDADFGGMELSYSFEDKPLGTAGSVKKACVDDEVLVISGDAMCDFDLLSAIDFHHKNNADATIIVKQVNDPREFGLVLYNSDGRVTGFAEKPSFESCSTDMANTGVYILSKSALDLIEEDIKSDFAQDIFPKMMNREMKLFAFEEKGYWCDIGCISTYMKCQQDMLSGKVLCRICGHRELAGIVSSTNDNFKGVKLIPPCYIGKNVSIASGSVIESGTIICDDVTIGNDCKIHGAVILDGAFLGNKVSCIKTLVCENALMLKGSSSLENSVVGEKASIGENALLEADVKVYPSKKIDSNVIATVDVKYADAKGYYLNEDGLCGETNIVITPHICALAGNAMASCFCKTKSIAIAYKNKKASLALAMAFSSGALSSGADIWDFGECIESELVFCMKASGVKCGCYIDAGDNAKIKFFSENGLPLTRSQERKIESCLNNSEFNKAIHTDFGEYKTAHNFRELYFSSLKNTVPEKLVGLCPEFKTSNNRVLKTLSNIIPPIIDIKGKRIIFHISPDGEKASAYTDKTGYVFYEKLITLACKICFEKGKDVSLPYSFPLVADEIATRYGREVFRYYNCSFDMSDNKARTLASECDFVNDGIRLSLIVIAYLSENNISLEEAIQDIPQFYATSRYVSIEHTPSNILKTLCTEKAGIGEGVAIKEDNSRVIIRPIKTGKGIQMFVESTKSETASELCDKFEKILKNYSN